jgi:hypothetical protein
MPPHVAENETKQKLKSLGSVVDEKARLEKLRAKLAQMETESTALSKKRQSLALDAHSDDPSARQQLDKIRSETLNLQFERDSLAEAITAQNERCRQADIAERQAKAKSVAVEDQERLAGLKNLAKQIDGHLEGAETGIGTLMTELRQIINRNGVSRPTEALLRTNSA